MSQSVDKKSNERTGGVGGPDWFRTIGDRR